MADQPETDVPLCCGNPDNRLYAGGEGKPMTPWCRRGCPASPEYWNRAGDAELRPLGDRD